MAKNQQDRKVQKKLPKRAGRRKELEFKRAVQHERGRRRKAARVEAQRLREVKNAALRAAGLPTPWEVAKAKARVRRMAARAV